MKKYLLLFTSGAICYAVIEILWRGYTHWSMMLAGGVCLMLFAPFCKLTQRASFTLRLILSAALITGVELAFGMIFNLRLGMGVWDYSHMPHNYLGQICLPYSFFWMAISIPIIPIVDTVNESFRLSKKIKR